MEKHILESLNWQLNFVTTFDFIEHFFSQGVIFNNEIDHLKENPS